MTVHLITALAKLCFELFLLSVSRYDKNVYLAALNILLQLQGKLSAFSENIHTSKNIFMSIFAISVEMIP